MAYSFCSLVGCRHRFRKNEKRNRLGQSTLWPIYQTYVEGFWYEDDKLKYICQKCHIKVFSQLYYIN
jgi:hypothetical protein